MTERRLPRWSELRPLLAPRRPELDPTARRLARAASVGDLRAIARRRAPRAVFDYADGAADTEIGLRRSREAFARVELIPRALRDVSAVDPSTTIFGRPAALPLAFAPTGFTRLFHHEGERAVARVAAADGHPDRAVDGRHDDARGRSRPPRPTPPKWFQLYMWPDRDASAELIGRAQAAGFHVLALTVDVAGGRLAPARRPQRPRLPPAPDAAHAGRHGAAPGVVGQRAHHRAAALRLAEVAARPRSRAWRASSTRRSTPDDVTWLRELWTGPLVVKGILTADDARRVVDARRRRRRRLQPRLAPARPLAHAARGAAGDRRGGRRPRRGLPGLGDPHAAPTSSPRWRWAPARASSRAPTATA